MTLWLILKDNWTTDDRHHVTSDNSGVPSHGDHVTESGDSHVTAFRGGRKGGHCGSEDERQKC